MVIITVAAFCVGSLFSTRNAFKNNLLVLLFLLCSSFLIAVIKMSLLVLIVLLMKNSEWFLTSLFCFLVSLCQSLLRLFEFLFVCLVVGWLFLLLLGLCSLGNGLFAMEKAAFGEHSQGFAEHSQGFAVAWRLSCWRCCRFVTCGVVVDDVSLLRVMMVVVLACGCCCWPTCLVLFYVLWRAKLR